MTGLRHAHRRAALALLLLVPAPTIGTMAGMVLPGVAGTPVGQAIYMASKLWLLVVPAWWWLFVSRSETRRPRVTDDRRGGIIVGIASGIAISIAIIAVYATIGRHLIDPDAFREAARASGLADPVRFLILAAYICTINALLEEIVWRWFVFRRSEDLLPAGHGSLAVLLCAAFFTVHHVVALGAQLGLAATVLGSAGVFIGGTIWSWCYLRYRSIWPGYISHAIVDVTIFGLGWAMLFWL